jgi:hypothetical protein
VAWLAAAQTDPSLSGLVEWAQAASQIGFVAGCIVALAAFLRRSVVPGSVARELQATLDKERAEWRVSDAAKDARLEAATKTLVEDVVPAVVRAQLTMERLEAELRARPR